MVVSANRRLQQGSIRTKVAELYLDDWTQNEIAAELNISQATVCRDIKYIEKEWQQSRIVDFDKLRRRSLATIEEVKREYWELYRKAQEEAITTIDEETFNQKNGEGYRKGIKKERRGGEVAALNGVLNCEREIIKLFGLSAETQIQAEQAVASKVQVVLNVLQSALPPEQLQVALNALRRVPELAEVANQVANTVETTAKTISPETIKGIREQVYGVHESDQ